MAPAEPQVIPELMAYLSFVVRASQDYEGLSWMRYDSAFRRHAVATGNKKWSTINPTLFAMNFSTRKSGTQRCELCFATIRTEQDCAQWGTADPGVTDRLLSLESAIIAMARPGPSRPAGRCKCCNHHLRRRAISGIPAAAATLGVTSCTCARAVEEATNCCTAVAARKCMDQTTLPMEGWACRWPWTSWKVQLQD